MKKPLMTIGVKEIETKSKSPIDSILVDFIINSNNRYIPLSDYNEDGSNDILDIIEVTKLILRN